MEEYNTITNCIRPTYNTMYFMTSPKLSINLLNGFNGILKLHDFFQDFHGRVNPVYTINNVTGYFTETL